MRAVRDRCSRTTQLADFKSHIRIVLSSEPDKKTSSTGDMDSVMTLDEIRIVHMHQNGSDAILSHMARKISDVFIVMKRQKANGI
jgi:hypothetical protein